MFSGKISLGFCVITALMAVMRMKSGMCQPQNAIATLLMEAPLVAKRNRHANNNGNTNNDDFEKFFLKASKSVPRIGRRRTQEPIAAIKLPLWSDLSDLYEYNPELFASPQLLSRFLQEYNSQLSDNSDLVGSSKSEASLIDSLLEDSEWANLRQKKSQYSPTTANGVSDEIYQYRLQP